MHLAFVPNILSTPYPCAQLPHVAAGRTPESAARRALLHTLAGIFRPLVPSITRPDHCTRPLWACAKTGYGWAGGADELPLAEALLGRLGNDGCALMRRAKPKEHASLWWSLSEGPNVKLVAAQRQLLAASAECLVGMRAGDMGPQECANVLLACARLRHSPTHVPLVHHLTRCLAEVSNPDAQHLSNGLYALGELREDCGHVPHQEDLRHLLSVVVQRLCGERAGEAAKSFIPQHFSNMLLGCAKLGVEDGEAVQLLAAAAGAAAGRMTEQHLSNSVWALGKLLGGSDVDGLSSPSRGAGGGDMTAALAVTQLLQEVQRRLGPSRHTSATPKDGKAEHGFKGPHLSNLLYGMALLQPYMDTVPPAQGGVKGSPAETVGPAVTAFANVSPFAAAANALAGEYVRQSFWGFKPQELANATWALAKMRHEDQGWFAAAVAAAQRPAFVSTAIPMHWAQLWYALALVRHRPPPGLMECTAGALEGQVRRAEPQQYAMLLWSFAVLGVWEERLAGVLLGRLAELVERQQQQQGQGQGQGQGSASGGTGQVGSQAPMVVAEQNVTSALWAVAVTGRGALAAHAREVGVLLREAARRWEQGGGRGPTVPFGIEELMQLWQVQLELEAMEGGEGGGPATLSSILLGARCGVAGVATAAPGGGSLRAVLEHAARTSGEVLGYASASQLQRDVVAALRRLQRRQQEQQQFHDFPLPASEAQPHEEDMHVAVNAYTATEGFRGSMARLAITSVHHEAPVPALGSRVDILVRRSDGRVVAVEVDGPTHFLGNGPHQNTRQGRTVLRDRQLARVFGQGNVVSVPYWEWNALQGDKAAEEQYVWGLLVGVEGAEVRAGREADAACSGVAKQGEGAGQAAVQAAAATGAAAAAEGKTRKPRQRRQQQEEQQGHSAAAAYAPGVGAAEQAAAGAGVDAAAEPAGARRKRPRAGLGGMAEGDAGLGSTVPGGAAAAPGGAGEVGQRRGGAAVAGGGSAAGGAGHEGQQVQVRWSWRGRVACGPRTA